MQRSAFSGEPRRSPISDERELYFSSIKFCCRVTITVLVNLLMVCLVMGVIVGLIYFRIFLYNLWEKEGRFLVTMATTIPSVINAFQIIILNAIYGTIAYKLTNFENHRTQSKYEKALIVKTFIFQFLNSFSLLFYIAFIKRPVTGCIDYIGDDLAKSKDNLCMREL